MCQCKVKKAVKFCIKLPTAGSMEDQSSEKRENGDNDESLKRKDAHRTVARIRNETNLSAPLDSSSASLTSSRDSYCRD